jgi:hypothetical protein
MEYTQGGPFASVAAAARCAVSEIFNLNIGDYIEAYVYQDSGAASSGAGGIGNVSLSMVAAGGTQGPAGPGTPSYGTSLPASPYDGQEAILVDSTNAPTYSWRFRYNAGSTSTYKWEFVGGSPAGGFVAANEGTSSTTFVDLATPQNFALPRSGDYMFHWYARTYNPTAGAASFAAIFLGATQQLDAMTGLPQSNWEEPQVGLARLANLAPGNISVKYRTNTGTGQWYYRQLSITPIRVS